MVRTNSVMRSNKISSEKNYTKESEAEKGWGPEQFENVSVYEYFSALALIWTCLCALPLPPHHYKYKKKKTAFQ